MNDALALAGFEMRPDELAIPADASFEDCMRVAATLGTLSRATPWMIGDLINFAETKWGERYVEVAEATGLRYDTLATYAYVARSVPRTRRDPRLSFSSHRVLASLRDRPKEQADWIKAAARNEVGSKELALAVKRGGPEILDARREVTAEDFPVETRSLQEMIGDVWLSSRKNGGGFYVVPEEPLVALAKAAGVA